MILVRRTNLSLALTLLLCACAAQQLPAAPEQAPHCDAQQAQFAVGQPYSDALAESARARSGAAVLRVLRVGMMATREFNADRLTMQLDGQHRIGAVRCG